MNGDLWLTIAIATLDLALVPTILNKKTEIHWVTATIYTLAMFSAMLGYASNNQMWPWFFQLIGFAEWAILAGVAVARRFWV